MENITSTIGLIKDAVSIMIPVITGFIVLVGASLGKLWDKTRVDTTIIIYWIPSIILILCSVLSLWLCFGAMGLCIKASTGDAHDLLWFHDLNSKELATYARYYLMAAYDVFSVSIAFAVLFFIRIIRKSTQPENSADPESRAAD